MYIYIYIYIEQSSPPVKLAMYNVLSGSIAVNYDIICIALFPIIILQTRQDRECISSDNTSMHLATCLLTWRNC